MRLSSLFPHAKIAGTDVAISGLAVDSRKVAAGDVFFAIPGTKADGLSFVPKALAAGAKAIVAHTKPDLPAGIGFVQVEDMRAELSAAAARFYPKQPQTIVAITGTSGKTSIAAFVQQIWLHLGFQAASLGTIGVVAPNGAVYGSLTTPDPITLHKTLDELANSGVTHLALEASSHGLDQKRLDGVRLSAAAFTNLSHDHLDYHANLAEYLAAKLRLFDTLLQPGQPAIIDADSTVADQVIAACKARGLDVHTTGAKGTALHLFKAARNGLHTYLEIGHSGMQFALNLPLLGDFQVANALVAAELCISTGGHPAKVFKALENLNGAPGRLELVGASHQAPIFIDYAHKPDALEKALTALRPFASNRLICVFGCGGDRDKTKRPVMGEIAARLADVTIVTDDNPRSEEAATIRREILTAAPNALEIADRGAAITQGVRMLQTGDVLLIAGKGHETGQIVGAITLPFSDHEAVAGALRDVQ